MRGSHPGRPPADRDWLAYEPGLASFNWDTLALDGPVRTQNPDAGAYAYARTRYEDSPLDRVVERGLPGVDFAMTPDALTNHTNRYRYGISDGLLGYAAGKFSTQTTIDPDGRTTVIITDLIGRKLAEANLAVTDPDQYLVTDLTYDAAGQMVQVVHPAGTIDRFTYDFIGRMTATVRADEGQTLFCYDRAGRLRFLRPATGAGLSPYLQYWKYDPLSRTVEQGGYSHAWDDQLQPDNPAWPAATPSNTFTYDGLDRSDLSGLGRLVTAYSGDQVAAPDQSDPFVAMETYFYDLAGDTVRYRLRVDQFRAVDYDIAYAYDNQGNVSSVHYPTFEGGPGMAVAYGYDTVGRVSQISGAQTRYVQFAAGCGRRSCR